MAAPKKKPARHATAQDTSEAVEAFMAALEHPSRDLIAELRKIVLGADGSIEEGIKWKAPSFRVGEYFATVHLRAKKGAGLILHLGAKARDLPEGGLGIADPEGLLQWLGKDRAMTTFADLRDLRAKKAALVAVLRAWIRQV